MKLCLVQITNACYIGNFITELTSGFTGKQKHLNVKQVSGCVFSVTHGTKLWQAYLNAKTHCSYSEVNGS